MKKYLFFFKNVRYDIKVSKNYNSKIDITIRNNRGSPYKESPYIAPTALFFHSFTCLIILCAVRYECYDL